MGAIMYKILIVDDEKQIREVLKEYAEFEGYLVDMAFDGMDAINKVKNDKFDLVVMDVMMPRLDGFSTVQKIREFSDVKIVMLSARGEEYDKLFGFAMGIDDYVVKPFSAKEVMARIAAILKRGVIQNNKVVNYEGLKIDLEGHEVYIDDNKISITPKEYDLLSFLVRNKNIAMSRDRLLNEVWGYDFYGDNRTVDTHIKMLRDSLSNYSKYIVTVRGYGYKFEV